MDNNKVLFDTMARLDQVERDIKTLEDQLEKQRMLKIIFFYLLLAVLAGASLFGCQKPTPPPETKLMMQPERRQLKWQQREVFHEWLSPDAWSAKGKADGTIIVPWHKRRVDLQIWAWSLKDKEK